MLAEGRSPSRQIQRGIMKKFKQWVLVFFCVVAMVSGDAYADDVLARLQGLPGVTAQETTRPEDIGQGLRRFQLFLTQPTDHFNPALGTFQQKLVLFHRSFSEPMVLQTSGYIIFGERLSRVARAFETNQVQVEHRFFGTSTPDPKDWTKLTVRQSAEDFHRITQTLKLAYTGRWLNTGASKGGMTSVYHRRFYPEDLDGTLADVAPLSFTRTDPRYIDFLNNVGGARYADCRNRIEALQLELLERRQEILPRISGNFSMLGGKEVAYEHLVISFPFIFWQMGNPLHAEFGCAGIPARGSSAEALAHYALTVSDPEDFSDTQLLIFQPYVYQAAFELGSPGDRTAHLAHLLQYPYNLVQYLPPGIDPPYTDATMLDMKAWVGNEAERILFIYGELDPWSAGAFRELAPAMDNHWFLVAGANHGANYQALGPVEKAAAEATLTRWLNKSPVQKSLFFAPEEESLEDLELRLGRR